MGRNKLRVAKLRNLKKSDARLARNQPKQPNPTHAEIAPVVDADEYFNINKALGPPYSIILDTSFINASIRFKIDIIQGLIRLLSTKCTCYITDCVMAELEKFNKTFSIALRLAKDPRIKRLKCDHSNLGYGDDCIMNKISTCKIYMVASNDRELRSRIRKVPGIPIIYAKKSQVYGIERLPDTEVM